MKRALLIALLVASSAFAQTTDQIINDIYDSGNTSLRVKCVSGCGGGGTPGGSSGDLQYNNAGAFGGYTPGTGVVTFLQTPTSANLAAALTDETGTGAACFANTPTLVTPILGAGTFTSLAEGADPADSGVIRLSNNSSICWESDPAGGDQCFSVNSSEQLSIGFVVAFGGENTYGDDTRQTFNPGANKAGINVGSHAGDPGTPSNGDIWYDSTANTLDARINGATVSLGAGGGGKPFWHRSANQLIPPTASYATLSTRNDHPVLEFDAAADECIYAEGVLSPSYAGGGLVVKIEAMAASATSGAFCWLTAFERENTDLDADSFASNNSASTTVSGTSGILTATSITHTSGAQMDSLAAGEPFRVRICRDGDGSVCTDDATGDAQILHVSIYEP